MVNELSSARDYYDRIFENLRMHHEWFRKVIPLIASENVPSPAVKEAIITDFGNRYAEGWPGERVYAGCTYIDKVELICIELAKKLYGAEFADVRPISGVCANLITYTAFTRPGDTIMARSIPCGGHISMGPLRGKSGALIAGTAGAVHGLNVEYLPFDHKELAVDPDKTREKLKRLVEETNFVPKVVLLDAGFHSIEHIMKLDKHFRFIMAAPKIQRYTNLKYEQVTSTISYSDIMIKGRRFRVIKKRTKNEKGKYEDHYFVTNIFDISVKRVLELYRKRWVIENSLFNEIKNGFELHIPSSNFVVSALYIELVKFAYNIFRLAMLRVFEAMGVRIRGVRRFREHMQYAITMAIVSSQGRLKDT